jgi:elongator complex protein 3 (tRNA carboxymethyluridine synthase)
MAGPVAEKAERLLSLPPPKSPEELQRRKIEWARSGKGRGLPSNAGVLASVPVSERASWAPYLVSKPSRSLSGVAVVAVMTSPAACPHGTCGYCPGGLAQRSPQSYTGEEPSALRGAQFGYDPRLITAHRIEALEATGHPTSKVEVIVMGGTFPSRPWTYQESVLRGVFEGLNGKPASSLAEAQAENVGAAHRCVSLTVETRPDCCGPRELPRLLTAGVTRIEIGVECLRDDVLEAVGRAHGTEEVRVAAREARDRGLKLCFHLMPGLPGMDPVRDLADFRRLFADQAYRPDMIKIYPTLVLPGTALFEQWQRGEYAPYETDPAVRLLVAMKQMLPPWVRVQRIQRDIPARLIAAGVRASNLRELALHELARRGARCRCLRCREVGRRATPPTDAFVPLERTYAASDGEERFLSFEDPQTDTIAGFLRLRIPSARTEGGLDAPVIRELKVLGWAVDVGNRARGSGEFQHRGLGRALVERAESHAMDAGYQRLYVLSAVGTRDYYARLGFEPVGPHMAKSLFA